MALTPYEIKRIAQETSVLVERILMMKVDALLETKFSQFFAFLEENDCRDDFIDVHDLHNKIHISEEAIKKRCQRNKLPGHKDSNGNWYFSLRELYDFFIVNERRTIASEVHDEQLGSSS